MNSRHQVRLYHQGLEETARSLRGDERIYSGLRPLDYHAGNSIVLAVYPQLLARNVTARGRPVRFEYIITLNDIEPMGFDLRTLHAIGPSIAFASDIDGVVARVREDLRHLSDEFPEIRIRFVPTSSLVETETFQRILEILTDEQRGYLSHFLTETYLAGRDLGDMEFMGRICGECRTTVKMSAENIASVTCSGCGSSLAVKGAHYWMHYIPLIAMKLGALQPDVVLLGSDYIKPHGELLGGMKHRNSLEAILDFYDMLPGGRALEFLLPPMLIGPDGEKMSKSLGNLKEVAYDQVLAACDSSTGSEITL